jgi:uncharacterized damage-inducible protein DinB
MNDQERMVEILERNQKVINEQSKELTHADSLLQLPFRSNCFNWVLGHIVVYRDKMLTILKESPVLGDRELEGYRRGSEPILAGQDVVDLAKILASSRENTKRLSAAIRDVSEESLAEIYDEEGEDTVQDWLEFLIWHETYHLGQLEILRQLAGKDDAII